MEKFVIQGGTPLSGEITVAGNKNAALPILAACLLTDEELVLTNVPRIRDVESQIALLEGIGVKVAWMGENELRLQADALSDTTVDEEHGGADPGLVPARRAAPGPLRRGAHAAAGRRHDRPPAPRPAPRRLPRHGRQRLRRSLDRDPLAAGGLRPCEIFMDEPSVMATENALLAAALTPGPTTIGNAACEPHVQDLARLLVRMGARIDGIGSNVMTVHGAERLDGRRARDLRGPHRGRELHGAGRGDRRRAAHPRDRARRPARNPPAVPAPRARDHSRGPRRPGAAGAGARRSATTSATRSRRSTTGPGRPSPPTSPRSRSRWRRRRGARS